MIYEMRFAMLRGVLVVGHNSTVVSAPLNHRISE